MRKATKSKSASKSARKPAARRSKPRKVNPLPKGYHNVTPYLIVDDAAAAIDFYKRAFGAKERMRMAHNGKVGHAELGIGDSVVMLADEWPDMGALSPHSVGGTPVSIHLYVKDVDAVLEKAAAAGAEVKRQAQDQFYGDRTGMLKDPYGHQWHVATHIEDVPPKELRRRAEKAFKQHQHG